VFASYKQTHLNKPDLSGFYAVRSTNNRFCVLRPDVYAILIGWLSILV